MRALSAMASNTAAGATRTVLDMRMVEIAALGTMWSVLCRWNIWVQGDRKLGDAMKILPPEDVAVIIGALVWGGFAHVEEPDGDDDST
jgi:hypothetical protein